jgi:cell division transport system permease protein
MDSSDTINTARPQRRRNIKQADPYFIPLSRRLSLWFKANVDAFTQSLVQIIRSPGSSFLTCAVIGVAITLPTFVYLVTSNFQKIGATVWQNPLQVTVFTRPGTTYFEAQNLARRLEKNPVVASVKTQSPGEALKQYQRFRNADRVLQALGNKNPFPSVLILSLKPDRASAAEVDEFLKYLEKVGESHSIHLDKTMVKQLYNLKEIGNRGVLILGVLLSLGVILIIGNTIRLDIQNKQDEIIITKLIGATNGYIRRPFLYSGMWYGIIGGIFAWIITTIFLLYLAKPVSDFAALSGNPLELSYANLDVFLAVLATGAGLGWIGSWISVRKHLRTIEPA